MALTQAQKALIAKVKAVGSRDMAVPLDDEICCYLVAAVASDLGLDDFFPELSCPPAGFFSTTPLSSLRIAGPFLDLFERLVHLRSDADSYFFCLATLHRARLKYERILQGQPVPTIDQVGPRGLLQFGSLSPGALNAFLIWRKWIYDIDNRAAQETGYVFELIVASAIGGVPASARRSPVKRRGSAEGRQVDCVLEVERRAYEIKLRVTIAASGQGRWQEELDFPDDCRSSGYTPVLVVLDPTANPRLEELERAFLAAGGETYVGSDAWAHLEDTAGEAMAIFLRKYVHYPIQELLAGALDVLPSITFSMDQRSLTVSVSGEALNVQRSGSVPAGDDANQIPEDVDPDP
jgi:hypothetical protein